MVDCRRFDTGRFRFSRLYGCQRSLLLLRVLDKPLTPAEAEFNETTADFLTQL